MSFPSISANFFAQKALFHQRHSTFPTTISTMTYVSFIPIKNVPNLTLKRLLGTKFKKSANYVIVTNMTATFFSCSFLSIPTQNHSKHTLNLAEELPAKKNLCQLFISFRSGVENCSAYYSQSIA